MSILNRLTIKNLRLNKKRTIVTIIGIILSTALMVGIGLLFKGRAFEKPAVCRHGVSRFKYNYIAGYQLAALDDDLLSVPHHLALCRGHCLKRLYCSLRLALLYYSQNSIEQHYHQYYEYLGKALAGYGVCDSGYGCRSMGSFICCRNL